MRPPRPTRSSAVSAGIGIARDLRHQVHVLPGGQRRDQVVELEYEADVVAPVGREAIVVQRAQVVIAEAHGAGGRMVQASQDVEQRRLARAGGPEQDDQFPGVEIEIHAGQSVNFDLAVAVGFGQALCLENDFSHGA